MDSTWHVLPRITNLEDVPALLIKMQLTESGYHVLMTDLTYVWCEKLDRQEIIRRASATNASIDPSEGHDQFQILLERIYGALRGEAGSTLKLRALDRQRGLILETFSPLPEPLQALDWSIHMFPAEQCLLTTELLMPLLMQHTAETERTKSLVDLITAKDHVIGKLVDKLDSSGVDVGTVFLSAAGYKVGRKSLSWDNAGRYVNGLEAFNLTRWKEELRTNEETERSIDEIVRAVFSGATSDKKQKMKRVESTATRRMWWETLSPTAEAVSKDHLRNISRPEVTESTFEESQMGAKDIEDSSEKSAQKLTTEASAVTSSPDHAKAKRRIGALGGSKPMRVQAFQDSPKHDLDKGYRPPPGQVNHQQAETNPGLSFEVNSSSAPQTKHRLGKIGGDKLAPSSGIDEKSMPSTSIKQKQDLIDEATTNPPYSNSGQEHLQSNPPPFLPATDGPKQEPADGPEAIQGTANRRREELKEQLLQATTSPTKKKRRF